MVSAPLSSETPFGLLINAPMEMLNVLEENTYEPLL